MYTEGIMTIQFVGLKEFRQNLAHYTKKAKQKNTRYIVLRKNVPVLEIRAIDEKDFLLEKLSDEINLARKDVKKGNIRTQQDILKEFGVL